MSAEPRPAPAAPEARGRAPAALDAVLSHHLNPFTSGVARFNQELARGLEVPVIGLLDPRAGEARSPLLSFKVGELGPEEREVLDRGLRRRAGWPALQVFLHDYRATALERRMVERAGVTWCGNHEVAARVEPLAGRVERVWAPGLISDTRRFQPSEISVFSFGMAHKLRTDEFVRLRTLLEASGRTYTVFISNANHETAAMEDAELLFDEMRRVFGGRLYFMGNLSDVAVFNQLVSTTFFSAFFPAGARANNTSIASAMEHGAVVITNLDEHSPPYLRHMDNVIDVEQATELPSDPLVLRRIGVRAMETARELTWPKLVDAMRSADADRSGPSHA
ncbi:MAG: hypothetical protein ACR2NV_13135 [Thermoleophilaceae bacterium]